MDVRGRNHRGITVMPNDPPCNIVLLNDDETPMDFVVAALQDFLDLDLHNATKLMLRVHHEGMAVCGIYERAEAERKVSDILAFAAKHGHPLKCILEEAN
jgi:ATP-dependent Clp protease adaptor protein ClpS